MKSIFKLSALALLATALTVSCEKEMAVEDVAAHQMERHTFTLAFAQPDTKLAITNEGKTTWEVGDEIMIHGGTDGKLRQKVTLTADDISADGKKATITFEMDPYDRTDAGVVSKFYAQYPASLVPEGAMYYECRFTGTNAPLMAACDVNDTFVFYNLCGIITFEADGEFDKFVFAGNGGETVGYSSVYQVRVRLDNGKEAPSVNYYKPGNGSGDPVAMKEFAAEKIDGVNYIYLPVGTNFSEGFNFKFYDGEELVKVVKTTTAVNVAAGKILALGDITSKLETYTPPTTSDHQPAEWAASATDLSVGKQAPANTYVLTAPGAYKIPAVKGNTTEAVGNVFDVELVWETYNNTEEVVKNSIIAEVDFDNDNLYFKTPDALKPGNALIAAKDYEGKIIWSWHIWIPSTAITTLEANGMFGTAVMDRNLGALTAVSGAATAESAGFLYQWGRKDPFMGVGAMAANTSTTMTTTGTFTRSKEQISVTTALANPTMFAYNGATAVDPDWKGLNWCTAENGDAWGTAEEKGVYDPCPAGYRVPAYNSSLPGWAKEDWTYDEANFYYKYSDAIFPFAGYLDDCSGSLSHGGDRSAFWSGTAYNADKGYSVDVRFKSGAATHSVTSQYKARGNSVRCVKIDGWVDPTPQTKAPAIEHVWGWYSSTDALWTSNVTAITITHPDGYGMARGLAMDDEYIYLPKSSGYAAIAGVKITDGATQVKGSVSGVNVGSTFQTSFVRMMKNTDDSVNGGKDILLLSNLTSTDAANLVIYAYTSGIENAPVILAQFAWDSANNVADWRRYGDRFFVTGTWQDGKIYLPSYNANKTVVLSVANGARTAVQQIAAGDASPDGIKDLTVYPGSNSLFLTNASIANLVAPTGGTSAQGWDEYKLSASSANGIGTWGYNFFTFNEKNYIAYARTSGNKAWVEVIEDKGDLLASLEAQEGLLKAPIHAADNLDAEHATGGVADCAVRVIDGVVYIASLTRDGGLSVDKLVLK
ncbi:MAG: hypothetical protein IKR96_00135 [Bacteroidales bacterium]|nr:hypothetical protein [Bacteroidales bacterium]